MSQLADAIIALINSKPQSPTKVEVEMLLECYLFQGAIQAEANDRPDGYLVTQEQMLAALEEDAQALAEWEQKKAHQRELLESYGWDVREA